MSKKNNDSLKVLFKFYSNALDEWTAETMWAEIVDLDKGHFKIDNIPFYASFACDDIIFAEYDENETMLIYKELVKASDNSTIQVIMIDKSVGTNNVREIFNLLGCESEKFSDDYFVINVPGEINYSLVKAKLSAVKSDNIIDFAESCLSEKHRIQVSMAQQ